MRHAALSRTLLLIATAIAVWTAGSLRAVIENRARPRRIAAIVSAA